MFFFFNFTEENLQTTDLAQEVIKCYPVKKYNLIFVFKSDCSKKENSYYAKGKNGTLFLTWKITNKALKLILVRILIKAGNSRNSKFFLRIGTEQSLALLL